MPYAETKVRANAREFTIERILDAAEQLMAEKGPSAISVREVADRAGVTHALVHHYFGSKDALFQAVIDRNEIDYQQILSDSLDIYDAMPKLISAASERRLYVMAQARASMDGVPVTDYELATGKLLTESLAKASATLASEATTRGIDPRVAMASAVAMALGWQVLDPWIREAFGLGTTEFADFEPAVALIADAILRTAQPATPDNR